MQRNKWCECDGRTNQKYRAIIEIFFFFSGDDSPQNRYESYNCKPQSK